MKWIVSYKKIIQREWEGATITEHTEFINEDPQKWLEMEKSNQRYYYNSNEKINIIITYVFQYPPELPV